MLDAIRFMLGLWDESLVRRLGQRRTSRAIQMLRKVVLDGNRSLAKVAINVLARMNDSRATELLYRCYEVRMAMSSRKGARAGGEKGATWVQE